VFKSYKYRIYPDESQKKLIVKHIDSVRFVYNLALETKNSAYIGSKVILSPFDLIKQLPELKQECTWLKEVNSQSLQQSIQNMDIAFKKFFKGAGFPKFKKKSNIGSFSVPQSVLIEDNLLFIPKFKKGIKIIQHRSINGIIRNATISKTSTGKYFASILVDDGIPFPKKHKIKESNTIGIDLGIKDFATTSKGEVINNPKHLRKSLSKLKYIQSKYSKYKGKRTQQRLALAHEKVANKRKDFLHKTSRMIINSHDNIALEKLNVEGMLKNHKLAQSISDASWGTFIWMLEYKSEWNGNNVLKIGQFAPSSKTCNICGTINNELTLKDRMWTCKNGHILDRDINAAKNIKAFALKKMLSGTDSKNQNELPTLVGVLTSESICHLG